MPPLAAAKSPSRRRSAPVNAPFSWPKSSDSSSVSGTAAQFTATNRPPRRGLAQWMACATSSFPVPLSPSSSTEESLSATARIWPTVSCMILERPRMPIQSLLPLDLRAQPLVLAAQPMVVEGAPHGHRHLGELEGLGQVVVGALAHGLDRGFQGAERRHQDDARRGPAPPGRGEHLEAADLVHDEIRDDHVELLGCERLQRRPAARRGHHRHVFALEMAGQHGGHVRIVVDDEDAPRGHASASYSGSQTVKAAPCPGRLRATMVPP